MGDERKVIIWLSGNCGPNNGRIPLRASLSFQMIFNVPNTHGKESRGGTPKSEPMI